MEFREFVNANALVDMGFSGSPFTWWNMQHSMDRRWERLDRGLCNFCWLEDIPNAEIFHLARGASDHRLLLLKSNVIDCSGPRSFNFEKILMGVLSSIYVVEQGWRKFVEDKPEDIFKIKKYERRIEKME